MAEVLQAAAVLVIRFSLPEEEEEEEEEEGTRSG
jgi:hypothetical protein